MTCRYIQGMVAIVKYITEDGGNVVRDFLPTSLPMLRTHQAGNLHRDNPATAALLAEG
jgi:hypothetical protein